MIDLDALALLVPPHGEGTVALRTARFVELLDEVRAARGAERQTPEDVQAIALIHRAAGENDPRALQRLMLHYYQDYHRARRTPRDLLYFHLGLLVGVLHRVLASVGDESDQTP